MPVINSKLREAVYDFETWADGAEASYALDAAGAIYRRTLSPITTALLRHYQESHAADPESGTPTDLGAAVEVELRHCVALALLTDLAIDPAKVDPIDHAGLIDLALLKLA